MNKIITWCFVQTDPARRRYGVAAFVGLIAGILSGFMKLGGEVPFPPRTPDRLTPPYVMLKNMGVDVDSMVYHFSGITINWGNLSVHFAFSIVFAVLYCIVAERFPRIKLWQGIAASIVIAVAVHVISFPLFGWTPAASQLPLDEYIAEFFGHFIWFWIIELIRRDLRNRMTGEPDAEVPLTSSIR